MNNKYPQASMSKDGQLRFTLLLEKRVGKEELIEGICWFAAFTCEDEDHVAYIRNNFTTRLSVFEACKKAYLLDGDSVWTWADTQDKCTEMREEASRVVNKIFTELK